MVRTYEKFEEAGVFGVIDSGVSPVVWSSESDKNSSTYRAGETSHISKPGLAYCGANEYVHCWRIKTGELVRRWHDPGCSSRVSCIARSRVDTDLFAVGYIAVGGVRVQYADIDINLLFYIHRFLDRHEDGSVRVWDSQTNTLMLSFNAHKSAVTCLAFDRSGSRLASGSKDTTVIMWDLVGEKGEFKLKAHKNEIVGIHFIYPPETTEEVTEDQSVAEVGSTMADQIPEFLLTTGKDSLMKLWDLQTRHCIETHIIQQNGECWASEVFPLNNLCITSGNGGELKFWEIDLGTLAEARSLIQHDPDLKVLKERGVLITPSRDRAMGIKYHPTLDLFAVHGTSREVQIWEMKSESEVLKSLGRKAKRRREKARAAQGEDMENSTSTGSKKLKVDISQAEISDIFRLVTTVRTSAKVRSCDWMDTRTSRRESQILVSTKSNSLEAFKILRRIRKSKSNSDPVSEAHPDDQGYLQTHAVDIPGHRADLRSLSLSSDDRMVASTSDGQLKIWNVKTEACLRSFQTGYGLAVVFLPGDKIVVVGTKSGHLELYDIVISRLIERIEAHEGAIWTMQVFPDGKSMATGSADKTVKFWSFRVTEDKPAKSNGAEPTATSNPELRLKLDLTRTLKLRNDVLNIAFSPDGRLIAVASLDNTVKVYFYDSLKLFLTLVGHKLPVLCMSVSCDNKLLATCSTDKNIRIWGLDFGDCHKALFAHADSIMQASFIPHPMNKEDSHILFTGSKDRTIKTWDCDKFKQIQRLTGHRGEIWALVPSKTGDFVISASRDASLRVWARTGEPLFLEEERDRELEQQEENELIAGLMHEDGEKEEDLLGPQGSWQDQLQATANAPESRPVRKATSASLTAGEKLTEALQVGLRDYLVMSEWEMLRVKNPNLARPDRDPIFTALSSVSGDLSAQRYVLQTMMSIPSTHLNDALLVLSFSSIPPLLCFILLWLREGMGPVCYGVSLLLDVLRIHHRSLIAASSTTVPCFPASSISPVTNPDSTIDSTDLAAGSNPPNLSPEIASSSYSTQATPQTLRALLSEILDLARPALKAVRETAGVNLAALRFLSVTCQKESIPRTISV